MSPVALDGKPVQGSDFRLSQVSDATSQDYFASSVSASPCFFAMTLYALVAKDRLFVTFALDVRLEIFEMFLQSFRAPNVIVSQSRTNGGRRRLRSAEMRLPGDPPSANAYPPRRSPP
jgi:hypothetical protein